MPTQVLLVEDSRAMRDYVCSILEAAGEFEVHEAGNGFDALRALPRDTFDLIITDINMPDVSGIELARFVRQGGRHAETPLIVISTDNAVVDRDRALAAGATAFLAKPFTDEQLLALVRSTLGRKHAPSGPHVAVGGPPSREDPT